MITITPDDEHHWLTLRDTVITSTVVSALFGLSPYTTRFEAYQHHANGIKLPFISNDRVEAGNRMEAYAAEEVGRKEGWTVEPFKDLIYDDVHRVGSSFDYTAETPEGKVILEIKGVDYFRHLDIWTDDQPPEHIEIQAQWQMQISGIHVCYVAAFTSIYEYHLYRIDYDPDMCKAMLAAVAVFWKSVDDRNEPDPDYARDLDIIAAMNRELRSEAIDWTDAEDMDSVLSEYQLAKLQEKEFKNRAKALKAKVFHALQDAPQAFTNRFRVSAKWNKDTVGKEITKDMVGNIVGARKGYRRFDVTELEVKE